LKRFLLWQAESNCLHIKTQCAIFNNQFARNVTAFRLAKALGTLCPFFDFVLDDQRIHLRRFDINIHPRVLPTAEVFLALFHSPIQHWRPKN
jgi:hypothetical protein